MTTLHRVLRFKQKPWLGSFVQGCAAVRAVAKAAGNALAADVAKLTANAVYGKTIQRSDHLRVKLFKADEEAALLRAVSKPYAAAPTIISEDLCSVATQPPSCVVQSPLLVGATIQDLAKLRVYSMLYETVLPRLPGTRLCYTDTDSLILHVPKPHSKALAVLGRAVTGSARSLTRRRRDVGASPHE